jgi:hypothetical protein
MTGCKAYNPLQKQVEDEKARNKVLQKKLSELHKAFHEAKADISVKTAALTQERT